MRLCTIILPARFEAGRGVPLLGVWRDERDVEYVRMYAVEK